ncbi:MAG TPA: TonB-dependent receptor [Bacteroidales bacterium]|nr:TonB-dependent receptor [Bacteroidales bacterium]HNS46094.1 TonB-dependent receptor [Bacteroidales bacterium]
MRALLVWMLIFIFYYGTVHSQDLYQTLKGTVHDNESNYPLYGASVIVLGTDPLIGAVSDLEGHFRIDSVPVGRYTVQVTYVGYQTFLAREIIIGTGKEVVLTIGLKETVLELNQVEIRAYSNKSEPINTMSTLSAKQISMEEANRYAGGMDDPARLVSSTAGVASSVGNNGVVIRGNSPKGLLWKMEGVQISNPNHFGDYISLGGGAVTALSSQTMAASDFFTGAFPAEYGNALSGVFDINMRTGNYEKREYVFQAGVLGIDFASEGPFKKGHPSSYLFNYRYSTLGLLAPILPKEMGKLTYQDLSFKLNFPSRIGTFSVWGIGAYDYQGIEALIDSTQWDSSDDRKEFTTKMTMGAIGINYKKVINSKTCLQSSLALTENSLVWSQSRFNDSLIMSPKREVNDYRWKYSFTGLLNHKFSARHTNRTGFILNRLMYDMNIKNAEEYGDPLITYIDEMDGSNLLQVFSQSRISFTDELVLNLGIYSQYLTLNDHFTIEPRLGMRWEFKTDHTLSFAYGLHSQMEMIQLFMVKQETPDQMIMPNTNLDFNKAHHIVLGYEYKFNDYLNLKAETYYQRLFDIPVVPGSYISTININEIWNFNDSLVNEGTGRNTGIDVTLEQYLHKGFYYLVTGSLFDSKYTGGDGIERNTKYNRNYIINLLAGKEWNLGLYDKNLFGANIRLTYMGGERIIPLDIEETIKQGEIVEDISHAYDEKLPDAVILSFSLSYRINKPKHASIWSFQFINALAHKDFQEYEFNDKEQTIEKVEDLLMIPNLSYKIEF